jgi:uncharacterized membrane protein
MLKKIVALSQQFIQIIKKVLLHGLFTLLPTVITVALLHLIFKLVKSWLTPLYKIEPAFLQQIPHSEILLTFVIIFITGLLYEWFLQPIIHRIEISILKKIPLLSLIYFGVKRLTEALTAHDKHALQQVMLVPFPAPGTYSIGFLTGEETPPWSSLPPKYLGLFVPHTPNPTTGFYIIVPEEQCIPLDISRQEAMTIVISGGLMPPQRFQARLEQLRKDR